MIFTKDFPTLTIFSRLPLKDVIKFSITSKRWKYLMETISMLEINDDNLNVSNSFHKSVEKFWIDTIWDAFVF